MKYHILIIMLFLSVTTSYAEEKSDLEIFQELSIKLAGIEIKNSIEQLIQNNPNMTISQLEETSDFQEIASQIIGQSGYYAITNSETGEIYYHPQKEIIHKTAFDLKSDVSEAWWEIVNKSLNTCEESSGNYQWLEEDGSFTEKFMFSTCTDVATADGVILLISATAYLNEIDARIYLDRYGVSERFKYAKEAIKQKSKDVAKQIDIYMREHPEMTLKDLQEDEYFQNIAVQDVGKTGYTAIPDVKNLVILFSRNKDSVGKSFVDMKYAFPDLYDIMEKLQRGDVAHGVYNWEDEDGVVRQKYVYHTLVEELTADGVQMAVGATTYLDEYDDFEEDILIESESEFIYLTPETMIVFLFIIFLLIFIVFKSGIIKVERKIIFSLFIIIIIMVSIVFIYNSNSVLINMEEETINSIREKNVILSQSYSILTKSYIDHILSDQKTITQNINFKEPLYEQLEYEHLKNFNNLIQIAIYDASQNLSGIYPEYIDFNISDIDNLLPDVVGNQDSYISGIIGSSPDQLFFLVYYPIIINDSFEGFVRNIYPGSHLIESFSEHLDTDSLIIILDNNHKSFFSSQNEYIGKNVDEIFVNPNLRSVVTADVQGHFLLDDNRNAFHLPFVIDNAFWHIIVISDSSESAAFIENNAKIILWTMFILIIFLIVIGYIFLRFLTKSLQNEISDKTSELNMRIDREKIMNNKLAIANQKLKALDLKKDQFITIAAHELKTPLTSIRGFSQLLTDKSILKNKKKTLHYLELIDNNTKRLYDLVLDLIDSTRINLGKLKIKLSIVSLDTVFKEIKENFTVVMKNKGFIPKFSVQKGLYVKADYDRLLQVIRNLLANAMQFSKKGQQIILNIYKDGRKAVFEVQDFGIGIPKNEINLIFERFYQVDDKYKKSVQGSGLGLPMCKGLVKMMKGDIKVYSKPDEGSKFVFTIPLVQKKK